MYEIIEVEDDKNWNFRLGVSAEPGLFLQSNEWAAALKNEKHTVVRLVWRKFGGGEIVAEGQAVARSLPWGGKYLFFPRGPVALNSAFHWDDLLAALYRYGQEKDYLFIRLEPAMEVSVLAGVALPRAGFGSGLRRVADVTPAVTLLLPLGGSAESLLAAMDKKTRAALRQARGLGLEIKMEKNIEAWWRLLRNTARRGAFRAHPKDHYAAVLNSRASLQLTAYYQGQAVASGVWWEFNKTLTYLFAASDHRYHKLLAPYALQGEVFKLAIARGLMMYDWFGIAPKLETRDNKFSRQSQLGAGSAEVMAKDYQYDTRHPLAGVTLFKIRFGGKVITLPGTYDLIISPMKYKMYRLFRKLRRVF